MWQVCARTDHRRKANSQNPNKDLVGYTATGEDEGGASQVQGEPGQLSETLFLVRGKMSPKETTQRL